MISLCLSVDLRQSFRPGCPAAPVLCGTVVPLRWYTAVVRLCTHAAVADAGLAAYIKHILVLKPAGAGVCGSRRRLERHLVTEAADSFW